MPEFSVTSKGTNQPRTASQLTPEEREEARKLRHAMGASYAEIAEFFGCDVRGLNNVIAGKESPMVRRLREEKRDCNANGIVHAAPVNGTKETGHEQTDQQQRLAEQLGLHPPDERRVHPQPDTPTQGAFALAPEVTSDFVNWLARELLETRAALERTKAELERTHKRLEEGQRVQVGNELARVYQEYTRRA